MKRLVLLIFTLLTLFIFSKNANSQANPEDPSNIGGGFVSLDLNFNAIDGKFAFFTGGSGGFIVKNIRLGVFFNGLTSNTKIKDYETNNEYKASCIYGGLLTGYPLWKSKRFHGLAELRLLIGNISVINADNYEKSNSSMHYGLIPSLGIEYYLTEIFAIGLNVEYKHCFFPSTPTLYDKTSLNSLGASISIKIGHFRW